MKKRMFFLIATLVMVALISIGCANRAISLNGQGGTLVKAPALANDILYPMADGIFLVKLIDPSKSVGDIAGKCYDIKKTIRRQFIVYNLPDEDSNLTDQQIVDKHMSAEAYDYIMGLEPTSMSQFDEDGNYLWKLFGKDVNYSKFKKKTLKSTPPAPKKTE